MTVVSTHSKKSKSYELPRELLKWHSSYFAAALDPESDFNSKREMCLTERHRVFDAFVCWLFTGRVKDLPEDRNDASANDYYLSTEVLIWVWIFADMRGTPGLGNAAIDMYHERLASEWKTCLEDTEYIFDHTQKGSALRKFVVDAHTLTKLHTKFINEVSQRDPANGEFLLDAIPILVKRGQSAKNINRKAWTELDRCQWHDHSGPGGKLRLESRKPQKETTGQSADAANRSSSTWY